MRRSIVLRSGPLRELKIIEVAGIGPGPYCAMLLADLGADVIRVVRPSTARPDHKMERRFVLMRGRRSVGINLKSDEGRDLVLQLVEQADALFEPYRPGVMERLRLGPDVCMEHNPALVYGRMTGWGQDGPLAMAAGHDINFIAAAGVLGSMGPTDRPPQPPLNVVGDFGGGGMLMAFGLVSALLEARSTGLGQVVDVAMVDGAASMMSLYCGYHAQGLWNGPRGTNLLDGGAWFYNTYETLDHEYMAVGAIEPQFCQEFWRLLGVSDDRGMPDQDDVSTWSEVRRRVADAFTRRTREEWTTIFAGSDACVTAVSTLVEAPSNPQLAARATFIERDGVVQPAPVPRFSRSPGSVQGPPALDGEHTAEILGEWLRVDEASLATLRQRGAIF